MMSESVCVGDGAFIVKHETYDDDDFFVRTEHVSILESMIPERDMTLAKKDRIFGSLLGDENKKSSKYYVDSDTESMSSESEEDVTHGVFFAEDPVTDVWERPATTEEERDALFYSDEDIWGFKLDKRKEKFAMRRWSADCLHDPEDLFDSADPRFVPTEHDVDGFDLKGGEVDDFSLTSADSNNIRKHQPIDGSNIKSALSPTKHTLLPISEDEPPLISALKPAKSSLIRKGRPTLSNEEEKYVANMFTVPSKKKKSTVEKRKEKQKADTLAMIDTLYLF